MAEIIRNRVIRPSTREKSSDNYKIDIESVSKNDTLLVNVIHESRNVNATYKFEGNSIADKSSIHFKVHESAGSIIISWSSVNPVEIYSTPNRNGDVKLIHRLKSQS